MSADFNKVITTEAYATLLATITDLSKALSQGLDPAVVTPLNVPTSAVRWNSVNGYWEKFNGTVWAALAATYAINISGSASKWGTGRTITIGGDASGTSGAWDGSGDLSFNITLATVAASKGGTGQTAYTVGDMLYADTAATLAKLAGVAAGSALISGGIGIAPSWGKVGLTTHISGTLAVGNGGTGAATAAAARINLGLVIGTDVMGMGGGTFTGAIAATNLSGTNTGDEPAASQTVAGIAEIATNAEVQTGTDAVRIVTPAGLQACTATTTRAGVQQNATDAEAKAMTSTAVTVTPSNLAALQFESAEQIPSSGGSYSVLHGLGAVPSNVELVMRCKTAELGYAVGDEIVYNTVHANTVWVVWKNASYVGYSIASSTSWSVTQKTGGATGGFTLANWRIVLRAVL